ncbi:condensation domain-containing protein [Paraburkholderia sp. CI3]|uniref:condensation domain-containing protein n=1 Tax=Paraburkholderia sp. CI3 TaxID=2991060 RepID=UPI003D1B538C
MEQGASPHFLMRELGAFERFLWATDRTFPKHFLLVLQVDGLPLSEASLRAALTAAQQRHPLLRVSIISDSGMPPRFVSTDEPIPFQVDHQIGEGAWLDTAALELATPFNAERGPLLRVRLLQNESVSHMMLAVHHAIGDGLSAAYLARDILESVEHAFRPALPVRASLDRLIGQPFDAPRLHDVSTTSAHMSSQLPAITMFSFPPDAVDELVLRCHHEQTTLHSAVMAAALIAMEGPLRSCLSPINARDHLPSIEDDLGLYITSGVTSVVAAEPNSFWEIARAVRLQLDRSRTVEHLHNAVTAMRSIVSNIKNDNDARELWASLPRELGYQAVLSNLGRLPFATSASGFRVSAAYLLLNVEAVPVVGLVTAGGRLSVSMSTSAGDDHRSWFWRFEHLLSLAAGCIR